MEDVQKNNKGLKFIRGLPFPDVPDMRNEIIEGIFDYVPHDGDIVLACYPKTGSTWLQYIVLQILSKGEYFPSIEDTIKKDAPIMEAVGKEVLDTLKVPRVYKHHIPYNMMQKNERAKVVYIYRNPEDTFVSFYHFQHNFHEMPPVNFEEFFEDFLTGSVAFGSFFKNVLSYFEHKNDKNLLLVSYEKLKLNTREEILRIAKFLGEEFYSNISSDESVMNSILEKTSFDYMKKNLVFEFAFEPHEESPVKIDNFFRKGIIGEGKQTLTRKQRTRLRKKAKDILSDCEVLEEWYGKDLD